jgi:hypothetical protein
MCVLLTDIGYTSDVGHTPERVSSPSLDSLRYMRGYCPRTLLQQHCNCLIRTAL